MTEGMISEKIVEGRPRGESRKLWKTTDVEGRMSHAVVLGSKINDDGDFKTLSSISSDQRELVNFND